MCKVVQPTSSTDDAMTSSGEVDHRRQVLTTVSVSPSQGCSGTDVTAWVPLDIFPPQQSMRHSAVCMAFSSTILPTEAMTPTDSRGWMSLVSVAPPHSELQLPASAVPVYICVIQAGAVTQSWLVGKFTYTDLPIEASPRLLTEPWPQPIPNPCINAVNSLSPLIGHDGNLAYRSTSESGPCSAIDEHEDEIHFASDTTEAPMASNVAQQSRRRHPSKKPRPQMSMTLEDYMPYPKIDHPAELQFMGDFHALASHWTPQEIDASRRLVCFWRVHHDSPCMVRCAFKVVSVQEYHLDRHDGVLISCIAYKGDLYVTSVDIIHFLENILCCQFSIDEKNRVRRNLEGFHPMTASKYHEESVDLFRHIMGFAEPKPRNIEKDIKIFPWHILPYAAKKIMVKHLSAQQKRAAGYMLPPFAPLRPPPLVTTTYSADQYEYFPAGPLTPQDAYPVYRKD